MTQPQSIATQPPQWKAWLWASRPKTLTAGVMPVLVASALAYHQWHLFSLLTLCCGLLSALCIQIGTNYSNDALDFIRGSDTKKRVGFARAVQMGWISSSAMLKGSYLAFALGILFSIPVAIHTPFVLGMVILCALFSYLYTGGPYPLAYKGLGELFVILFYGWAITGTVYYAQTGFIDISALAAGLQLGLLSSVILALNNLRDISQDAEANKKTLAVRFGVLFAKLEIIFCLTLVFLLNLFWWQQSAPLLAILPLASLPLALRVATETWSTPPSASYNAIFGKAALLHILFCTLFLTSCILS